jgi:hypothetical protein
MTQTAKLPSTATRRTGGGQSTPDGHGPRGEHDVRGGQHLVGDRDRDDGDDRDDRTERAERNSRDEQSEQRVRLERDARREDRADDRDVRNGLAANTGRYDVDQLAPGAFVKRVERDSRDEQSDQRQQRGEQDLRREQGRVGDRDERALRAGRGEQWHGDRGELGDGREPRRQPGGVQRTVAQVTDRVRAATSNPGDAFAPTADMSKVVTAWFDMAGDMMKLQQQFFASLLGAGNTNDRTTTRA